MGLAVFFINLDHGWQASTIAAIKQFAYTFLFGGVIIKILEKLLLKFNNKLLALVISASSVSIITIILILLVHTLKGTPEPMLSTIPTILMAPPGFLVLALRFQRKNKE